MANPTQSGRDSMMFSSTGADVPTRAPVTHGLGTLIYTRIALIVLFFWLLWSALFLAVKDVIKLRLVPIILRDHGLSNAEIGVLIVSVPAFLTLLISPLVGCRSDRLRSRYGRRIPFLVTAAPFMGGFSILTAYHLEIGGWLHTVATTLVPELSKPTIVALCLVAFFVLFQIFDLIVVVVYPLLINDVVPARLMGRFFGLYRTIGSAAAFSFNFFLLGFLENHAHTAFGVAGVACAVALGLTCWRVKEGSYPEPLPSGVQPGNVVAIRSYFNECFREPVHRWLFVGIAGVACAYIGVNLFSLFFALEVGVSLFTFGKLLAGIQLGAFLLSYPLGYLADRIHPLRLGIITIIISCVLSSIAFMCVQGPYTFIVFAALVGIGSAGWTSCFLPLLPAMLPRDRYGQLFSASALLSAAACLAGGYLVGLFIDVLGGSYRYIYLWNTCFGILSLIALSIVYRLIQKRGGFHAYASSLAVGMPVQPTVTPNFYGESG